MSEETIQEEQLKLIRKSLIVQLAMLGLSQQKIRSIVGCDWDTLREVLDGLEPKKLIEKQGGKT